MAISEYDLQNMDFSRGNLIIKLLTWKKEAINFCMEFEDSMQIRE